MPGIKDQYTIVMSRKGLIGILQYLFNKWYYLITATILGGLAGYYNVRNVPPAYTATISFVLSTDAKNNELAGLVSQLGFEGLSGSTDNIFTGENIIELFKSRKLVGAALLSVIDSASKKTLLNYIAQKQYGAQLKAAGLFNNNPQTYTPAQNVLYRQIITDVGRSFVVFKKDKKLIFYQISATSADADIANYIAKYMLYQTSKYFIETKTEVSLATLRLLKHEADSIATTLRNTFASNAAILDHSFNLNPAVSIQRSGSLFNQAKVAAFSAAFTEVMRNLEVAKLTLQKETPLYRIIDEPELPLPAIEVNKVKRIAFAGVIALLLATLLFVAVKVYKLIQDIE